MWRIFLIFTWFIATSVVLPGQGTKVEILEIGKTKPVALPYLFDVAPIDKSGTIVFLPKPDDISCNLLEMGQFGGRKLICFRYLKGDPKDNGRVRPGENPDAQALSLMVSVGEKKGYYAPIVLITKMLDTEMKKDVQPGTAHAKFDDLTVSSINHLNDLQFIWLRVHHKGDEPYTEHFTIVPGAHPGEFRLYDLFSNDDPLATLKQEGWQEGGRRPQFDEDTLTWNYYLSKANSRGHYQVKYTFREGQLHPSGEPVLAHLDFN